MILDALNQFSSAQNLAQVVGSYVSTNIIDLGLGATATSGIPNSAAGGGARDIGIGDKPAMKILCLVTTTFTGAASTLAVTLQGAVDNGSGVPATFTNWYTSPVFALATLTAGTRLLDMDMPRPPAGVAVPRFLQMSYAIAGGTSTAGNVTS